MKRYSIMVREIHADHEIELCQCDGNAEDIASAARKKSLMMDMGGKPKRKIPKYEHIYVRDNAANAAAKP